MATITHKTGDTLEWVFYYTENQLPADITNYTIACMIRTTDGPLVQTLTVTKTDAANGVFSLTATAAQTGVWPLGDHVADVQVTEPDGTVHSCETFTVKIIDDITV